MTPLQHIIVTRDFLDHLATKKLWFSVFPNLTALRHKFEQAASDGNLVNEHPRRYSEILQLSNRILRGRMAQRWLQEQTKPTRRSESQTRPRIM